MKKVCLPGGRYDAAKGKQKFLIILYKGLSKQNIAAEKGPCLLNKIHSQTWKKNVQRIVYYKFILIFIQVRTSLIRR